jgi:large subunit ribosomal protein L9
MSKNIEVLLRENVKDLGKCGDLVKVRPGYARNMLYPRRIAIEATEDNKKAMLRRRAVLDVEDAKRSAEVEARVSVLNGIELQTAQRADDHGHLYGSVSAAAIVALLAAKGHAFEEKAVRLDAPIKEVGTYPVKVHVHGDHYAAFSIVVTKAENA